MEKSNDSQTSAGRAHELSEADFLAEQAAAAQRALTGTLERMRADLGASADLSAWARRYPWPTLGVAAAAGFLAVVAIGSPRTTETSAAPSDRDSADEHSANRHSRAGKDKDRGLFYSLASEVLRNFATAAQGALLAAIGARFQSSPGQPDTSPVPDPTTVGATDGNGFAPSDS